jgi:hypothetical protein
MSDFERRTRELLHESVAQLDASTRSRLTQARFAAVETARRRRGAVSPLAAWRGWMPLGGAAAAVLAVLVWSGGWERGVSPDRPFGAQDAAQVGSPFDDLDLIAADESMEMMEELEFYAWLDTQPPADGVNITG